MESRGARLGPPRQGVEVPAAPPAGPAPRSLARPRGCFLRDLRPLRPLPLRTGVTGAPTWRPAPAPLPLVRVRVRPAS